MLTRSIPAWAGEPYYPDGMTLEGRVYPRVGGGTTMPTAKRCRHTGLSPRGRGNRIEQARLAFRFRSIPAWAGNPAPPRANSNSVRSIPAWAGEPTPASGPRPSQRVYPRVGGGTSLAALTQKSQPGLSPRGRGNRTPYSMVVRSMRSIPAWAGEPIAFRPESR